MTNGEHNQQHGARLFARWLFEQFEGFDGDADKAFDCIVGLILEARKYFEHRNKNRLVDNDLYEILSFEPRDDNAVKKKLDKEVRALLKVCRYKQANILNGVMIRSIDKRSEINKEVKALNPDEAVSALIQILEELCKEFGEIVEEGQNMAEVTDNFQYDVSCLPDEFKGDDGEQHQQRFTDKVRNALANMIQNGGDEILPAVIGLMLLDGHSDITSGNFYTFVQQAFNELNALTSYKDNEDDDLPLSALIFFKKLYVTIEKDLAEGEKIFFHDFAAAGREVVRNLDTRNPKTNGFGKYMLLTYKDKNFSCGLETSAHGGGNGIVSIDLPPLSGDGAGSDEIVPDNIRAVSTIYMAYQLEQLQLIPATDRIVELSMAGLLAYTYDNRTRIIDEYAWSQTDRLNDVARYSQYSRALGAMGGQVTTDVVPNTQFSERLRHSVSSIANFANTYDTQKPLNDRSEYVRKSIRDLAANASYYGWAGTYFVAERLRKHINDAIAILSLPQIQDAYGVTNMWQVIERVAQREFGITVNVPKHWTLAMEGKYIFEKIAERADLWSGPSSGRRLFTISQIRGDQLVEERGDLNKEETGRMFRAAQYILAVEGYGDSQVDQYSHAESAVAGCDWWRFDAIG